MSCRRAHSRSSTGGSAVVTVITAGKMSVPSTAARRSSAMVVARVPLGALQPAPSGRSPRAGRRTRPTRPSAGTRAGRRPGRRRSPSSRPGCRRGRSSGTRRRSRARSSSEKSESGMPACSALSAKYSPSPPEFVIDADPAAARRLVTRRRPPGARASRRSRPPGSRRSGAASPRSCGRSRPARRCARAPPAAPSSDVPTFRTMATLPASARRRSASSNAAGRRTASRKRPTTRVAGSSANQATKSAASVTVSLPDEITVRKPMRGPSDTRISPIEPEWASVATGPGTNVGCRLPIHGDGAPGVAMPMQLGPTIATPASAHPRRDPLRDGRAVVARPRSRARA